MAKFNVYRAFARGGTREVLTFVSQDRFVRSNGKQIASLEIRGLAGWITAPDGARLVSGEREPQLLYLPDVPTSLTAQSAVIHAALLGLSWEPASDVSLNRLG